MQVTIVLFLTSTGTLMRDKNPLVSSPSALFPVNFQILRVHHPPPEMAECRWLWIGRPGFGRRVQLLFQPMTDVLPFVAARNTLRACKDTSLHAVQGLQQQELQELQESKEHIKQKLQNTGTCLKRCSSCG